MRLLRHSFVLFALIAATLAAKADTIEFTTTITSYNGLSAVPIGTTYTGFAHYAGKWDLNSTGYPPTIDAFGFNYPSTPSSLSDFLWAFTQRHYIGGPLFLGVAYINQSVPLASFYINAATFSIVDPLYVLPNGFGYLGFESGPVTYSYLSDPAPAPTPEPASLLLAASGLLSVITLRRPGNGPPLTVAWTHLRLG